MQRPVMQRPVPAIQEGQKTSGTAQVQYIDKKVESVDTMNRLLSVDANAGEVQLLSESGETKDDISLPKFTQEATRRRATSRTVNHSSLYRKL